MKWEVWGKPVKAEGLGGEGQQCPVPHMPAGGRGRKVRAGTGAASYRQGV